MIDTGIERAATLERGDHGLAELEAQEVHGRGLGVVLALHVLVGDGVEPLASGHLHPATILDAAQQPELHAPFFRIRKLDQQGHLPVASVGDQRVVGGQLLGDSLGFEDALGAQHLLDLVLHREPVLEQPHGVGTHRDLAVLLVRHDARAKLVALARVAFQGQQIRLVQLPHCRAHIP